MKEWVLGIALLCLLPTGAVAIMSKVMAIHDKSSHEALLVAPKHAYETPAGTVHCASMSCGNCGCSLRYCDDGASYSCMQNVRRRPQ